MTDAKRIHWADAQGEYRSPCGANADKDQVVFAAIYRHRVTCPECKAWLKRRQAAA